MYLKSVPWTIFHRMYAHLLSVTDTDEKDKPQ